MAAAGGAGHRAGHDQTGDRRRRHRYLVIAGAIGVVSLWFLQEPNGRRMGGSPPSAATRKEAVHLTERQQQAA